MGRINLYSQPMCYLFWQSGTQMELQLYVFAALTPDSSETKMANTNTSYSQNIFSFHCVTKIFEEAVRWKYFPINILKHSRRSHLEIFIICIRNWHQLFQLELFLLWTDSVLAVHNVYWLYYLFHIYLKFNITMFSLPGRLHFPKVGIESISTFWQQCQI